MIKIYTQLTISNISDYVAKINNQVLIRKNFSGNLSTLKITISPFTLSYGTHQRYKTKGTVEMNKN